MSITGKLSRRLHETLGDEAADEMVGWMQGIDAQRAELRELNELSVSRLEARFDQVEARFDQVEARFGQVEARFGRVDARFGELEVKLEAGLAKTDADLRRAMEAGFARLEVKIEQRTADIMKWSFVFWVGSIVALAGALAALARFLR